MKKFENLGRKLSKLEQKNIIGGRAPAEGQCIGCYQYGTQYYSCWHTHRDCDVCIAVYGQNSQYKKPSRLRRMCYPLTFVKGGMKSNLMHSLISKNNMAQFLFIFFLLAQVACKYGSPGNEQHPTDKQNIDKIEVVRLSSDTTKYKTIKSLVSYYKEKTDSLEKLQQNIIKSKGNTDKIDISSFDKIQQAYYDLLAERNNKIYQHIATNPKTFENFEGLLYLVVDRKISIGLIDSLYKTFEKKQHNTQFGKMLELKIKERLEAETLLSYETSLLNIKLEKPSGEQISLNQINSKYILLDFWASWCAPCRYENRILVKEMKELTGNNDMEIVAVSLDKSRDRWLKAIRDDSINYLSVCDFKELESSFVKGFKVKTVPYNLLIDKKGNVLAHNLWGRKLKEFLKLLKN